MSELIKQIPKTVDLTGYLIRNLNGDNQYAPATANKRFEPESGNGTAYIIKLNSPWGSWQDVVGKPKNNGHIAVLAVYTVRGGKPHGAMYSSPNDNTFLTYLNRVTKNRSSKTAHRLMHPGFFRNIKYFKKGVLVKEIEICRDCDNPEAVVVTKIANYKLDKKASYRDRKVYMLHGSFVEYGPDKRILNYGEYINGCKTGNWYEVNNPGSTDRPYSINLIVYESDGNSIIGIKSGGTLKPKGAGVYKPTTAGVRGFIKKPRVIGTAAY